MKVMMMMMMMMMIAAAGKENLRINMGSKPRCLRGEERVIISTGRPDDGGSTYL
jgi:hypothetical protein